MSSRPLRVVFRVEADGREVVAKAKAGELLSQVAYRVGVVIQTTCGGKASCTDCLIRVERGLQDGFEKAGPAEIRVLGNVFHITHERLACQAQVKGDSDVLVPKRERKKR